MHRIIIVAVVALSAAFGSARAEVLIGVSAAMTGRLAWIGEQGQRGAEMAVAEVNAQGGVLGQKVRLISVDDFCDPQQAVAAAKKRRVSDDSENVVSTARRTKAGGFAGPTSRRGCAPQARHR
jgi:ABC-type branched-subunit amino acid transport system substrate-binding protein